MSDGQRHAIAALFILVFGLLLIYGARRRWRLMADPPPYLFPFWPPSLITILFGPRGSLVFSYIAGGWFAFFSLLALAAMLADHVFGIAPPPLSRSWDTTVSFATRAGGW